MIASYLYGIICEHESYKRKVCMLESLIRNKEQKKEVKCFEEQIVSIYGDLSRYIYCIVGNRILAEDAIQNTLLNAYMHISDLNDKDKFRNWIYTIGKRESINILRKYKRELSLDSEDFVEVEDEQSMLPDNYVLSNELKEAVVEGINSLNSRDREIVILYYYADLNLQEVAEILNINSNTIRTRHRSIKKSISRFLIDKGLFLEKNQSESLKGGF